MNNNYVTYDYFKLQIRVRLIQKSTMEQCANIIFCLQYDSETKHLNAGQKPVDEEEQKNTVSKSKQ